MYGEYILGLYYDYSKGHWYVKIRVIPHLGRCDVDHERYHWSTVKLPKGFTWRDARTFKDLDRDFPRVDFLIVNTDLIVRFTPARFFQQKYHQPKLYLTIRNFRELRAQKVLNDLCGYDKLERIIPGETYPMGMHFEDGIWTIWKDEGLNW